HNPAPGSQNTAPQAMILPTPEEVKNGALIPFSTPSAESGAPLPVPSFQPSALRSLFPETWFPLSIAPALTRADLLKFIAYAALFFLVLLYPFSQNHQRSAIRNQRSAVGTQFSSALRTEQRAMSKARRTRWSSDTPSLLLSPHHSLAGRADGRFLRSVLLVVLLTGCAVAAVGFAQQFSWNGKILWFFVPYDWGAPAQAEFHRASGPFVNPGHFANYLSLILPLSLACAIIRLPFVHERLGLPFRIFGAFTALLLFIGILLSLSRSGWISALLGATIFLWFSSRRIENRQSEPSGNQRSAVGSRTIGAWIKKRGMSLTRVSIVIVMLLIMVSLFFVGPSARGHVEARLGQTVTDNASLWGRTAVWQDTLGMLRDFPLFGVGLGSWPELFPRYRRPPWSGDFYREAHNDYIELWAETGIVGIGLLGWFFFQTGTALLRGFKKVSPQVFPLLAAISVPLVVMAFHELLDFNLQIPANAFLFTLLMALGLRITGQASIKQQSAVRDQKSAFQPAAIGLIALVLTGVALSQDQVPYPYNLYNRQSVVDAKKLVLTHPANALSHISLLRSWEGKAPLAEQHRLVEASQWLDPTNPHIRDVFASTFLRMGKTPEGLSQITRSISDSPAFSSHYYLTDNFLPWLLAEEQNAVEEGFKQAVARSHPGALENFATFYARFGRFSEQAGLFEDAARRESDSEKNAEFLLKAGIAYITANDEKNADRVLSLSIAARPQDSRAYHHLITSIYGPKKDLAKARAVISNGVSRGAAPLPLYLSLAQAAEMAGNLGERAAALEEAKTRIEAAAKEGQDPYPLYILMADAANQARARQEEKAALLAALDLRPRSVRILFRVADLYRDDKDFDHATLFYRKLAGITPASADVHFHLAVAEEGRYRFAAAKKAYTRAVELAPANDIYRKQFEAFKERVERDRNNTLPAGDDRPRTDYGSPFSGYKHAKP
ncbi:MAG: O-antigen ligase family protein, partial [Deltaproteobacteria bacterium]|nr:O-antigen ligase family protein [Deltaproteobacteria bacterium]